MVSNLFGSKKKSKSSQSTFDKSSSTTYPSSSAKYPNNFADTSLSLSSLKSPGVYPDNSSTKLTYDSASSGNIDLVIQAAYKQVFGNVGLMESERLPQAESQLRNERISVKEFIRRLAKSEKYRSLFWDNCTNLKAIEFNFKHLLGRTPEGYSEISQHIQIIAEGGLNADIDSYLDSEEYEKNYGETLVPYYRGYTTQAGKNLAGYVNSIQSSKFTASSDTVTSEIVSAKILAQNKIKPVPGVSPAITISVASQVPASLPYFGGSQEERASDLIPDELIDNVSARSVYSSSGRRKPIVDKKFLDMARNTPYYLR